MRLRELLKESTSKETSLMEIISKIGEIQSSQLYPLLKDKAKSLATIDNLEEFKFQAAGIKDRFFQKFYLDTRENKQGNRVFGLQSLLERHFMRYLPDNARDLLQPELSYLKKVRRFDDIEYSLPKVLVKIGQIVKSQRLVDVAKKWIELRDDFEYYFAKLEADQEEKKSADTGSSKTKKPPKDTSLGQQRGQVEQLINDVLKDLPEKVRGEIRQAIARDDNKLMALQRELTKRNIQMEE